MVFISLLCEKARWRIKKTQMPLAASQTARCAKRPVLAKQGATALPGPKDFAQAADTQGFSVSLAMEKA
jgi:hypothetical protein